MQSKTHFKNFKKEISQAGLTLIEMMVAVTILLILTGISYSLISASVSKSEARDNKRLGDISNMDRAINEYRMDLGSYPGIEEVLYASHILPEGSISLYTATSGWIGVDMSEYLTKYMTDPTNDATYHYEYMHNSSGYEICALLENPLKEAESDGGDNISKYELGNNLTLIQ